MTTKELIKTLKTDENYDDLIQDLISECGEGYNEKIGGLELIGIFSSDNGSINEEGDGGEFQRVFQVGNELFSIRGCYSSWDGHQWDIKDLKKVTKQEKTIIVYE